MLRARSRHVAKDYARVKRRSTLRAQERVRADHATNIAGDGDIAIDCHLHRPVSEHQIDTAQSAGRSTPSDSL